MTQHSAAMDADGSGDGPNAPPAAPMRAAPDDTADNGYAASGPALRSSSAPEGAPSEEAARHKGAPAPWSRSDTGSAAAAKGWDWDYIVVGGGSAGCVLAARLSEDADARVLLLEAGDRDPLPAVTAPADRPSPQAGNNLVFMRGHRSSYDAWAAAGAKGWGFEELLPFFKRSERALPIGGIPRDPALRGADGPLGIASPEPRHPLAEAFLAAAVEAGHPFSAELGGGLDEGFGWADLTLAPDGGQSAADAYLAPCLDRPNLTVMTRALAHRVLVEHGRCVGVEYAVGGALATARCVGEVVLAAGTVGSARLLMLSGLGPPASLRDVGIDVLTELPGVGANLHDHPRSFLVYRAARTVPPGAHAHGDALGLLRADCNSGSPDVQIHILGTPGPAGLAGERGPGPGEGYSVAFAAMLPRSRGTVRLASADPAAAARLDPGCYRDPDDLRVMTEAFWIAYAIGAAAALEDWRGAPAAPARRLHINRQVHAHLRRSLRPSSHQAGTCRIGTDPDAVVDSELRVHGMTGLRVADASVMPSPVSADPAATVYAIAERAAQLIRRGDGS